MTAAPNGVCEIREAASKSRRFLLSVGFFGAFVKLLMLPGSVFMLQVYDRVLTSRSEAKLATLGAITAFLFLMMGVLDHARGRVLRAILARSIGSAERARPVTGLRDFDAIQRFAWGAGPFAVLHAPWTPAFLCALFLFHRMLGLLAIFSGALLSFPAFPARGTPGFFGHVIRLSADAMRDDRIRTGTRSVISYLVEPLTDFFHRSPREE